MQCNDVVVRKADVESRVLDKEAILLVCAAKTFYKLNETATVAWQLADGKRTIGEIASELHSKAERVSKKTIEKDLLQFFSDLKRKGAIEIAK